jgi:hypothetical protein
MYSLKFLSSSRSVSAAATAADTTNNSNSVKQLNEESARLEAQEDQRDKLRYIYSDRITGFKFVCGKCYDYFYQIAYEEKRKGLIPHLLCV